MVWHILSLYFQFSSLSAAAIMYFAFMISTNVIQYYISCIAFAEDVFQTKFAHDPCNRETWNAYRRETLEVGGAHGDFLRPLTQFLGRAPNSRALVDRLTLSGDISEMCLRSRDADQRLTVEISRYPG